MEYSLTLYQESMSVCAKRLNPYSNGILSDFGNPVV